MKRYILVIICLMLSIGGISVKAHAAISATERAALIALYNSTNGDSWIDNPEWKGGTLDPDGFQVPGTEGSWFGITLNYALGARLLAIGIPQ